MACSVSYISTPCTDSGRRDTIHFPPASSSTLDSIDPTNTASPSMANHHRQHWTHDKSINGADGTISTPIRLQGPSRVRCYGRFTNLQSLFAEDGEITHAGISRTFWAMIPAAPISCSDRQEMDERSGPSPAGLCLKPVKARPKVWVSSRTAAVQGIWKSALAFAVHPEPGVFRSSKVSENDRSIQQSPTQQQRRGFPSTCE